VLHNARDFVCPGRKSKSRVSRESAIARAERYSSGASPAESRCRPSQNSELAPALIEHIKTLFRMPVEQARASERDAA
jgi:hypothetical protein